jgi:Tol biopolymer transport system component
MALVFPLAYVGLCIAACTSLDGLAEPTHDAGAATNADPSSPTDAGDLDAPAPVVDGGAVCDPSKPFGVPALVQGINSELRENDAHLTPDELEIFFSVLELSGGYDIYMAKRPNRFIAFNTPTLVASVKSDLDDRDPTPTPDGLGLLFSTVNRDGGTGNGDFWQVARATRESDFGLPVPIKELNSPEYDLTLALEPSGAVWFASNRYGTVAFSLDLYRAEPLDGGYKQVAPVAELNTGAAERAPVPSADGTYVYFASDRADGGVGLSDIWMAKRAAAGQPFGVPVNVKELNTDGEDFPTWLSPDGCRLYFSSKRNGNDDIWVAERQP